MSPSNIYKFRLSRGKFIELISFFLGPFSLAVIFIALVAVWMSFSEYEPDADMPWSLRFFLLATAAVFRCFVVVVRRLILRRVDVRLFDDRVEITYKRFLFLPTRTITLPFGDMTECRQISTGRKGATYLLMKMRRGSQIRICDDLRWFAKMEPGDHNFGIKEIAEMHQLYKSSVTIA